MSGPRRLPLGSQVVVSDPPEEVVGGIGGRGVTGRVVRDHGAGYTVVLPGGRLAELTDNQVMLAGQHQGAEALPSRLAGSELVVERTIFAAAVGPATHTGTIGPEADIRAVYQAPTSTLWSLNKPPKHVAGPGSNWFSWEVERFCELALKAHPTCLELLWSPAPVWVSEAGCQLADLRGAFLSAKIASSYGAHTRARFKKLEEDDRQAADQRWKQAAHALRLMMDGVALLNTGHVAGPLGDERERWTSARGGELSWAELESWRDELQQRLDEAATTTFLPADPDVERVDRWLSGLRRRDAAAELV